MIGKASEIKTDTVDTRELNEWLLEHHDTIIVNIQFAMAATNETGVLPHALIIYKEETHE